jgi:hypothetical protein
MDVSSGAGDAKPEYKYGAVDNPLARKWRRHNRVWPLFPLIFAGGPMQSLVRPIS